MKRMSLYLCMLSLLVCMPLLAHAAPGAVYAMTNPHPRPNEIVVYRRAGNGRLTLVDTVATGGFGYVIEPNDALGSQGPLLLSPDNRWLFAVNAGTDPDDANSTSSISVFKVDGDNLTLVEDPVNSGGNLPVSLTLHDNHLYVLNAGGPACNITGFTVEDDGRLTPLNSTFSFNTDSIGYDCPVDPRGVPGFLATPAQVGFNPQGDQLVVTVKGLVLMVDPPIIAPQILVFPIDDDGSLAGDPTVNESNVPFAFVFNRLGNLSVTEPFGDAAPGTGAAGAVSSYLVDEFGSLSSISATVENGQTATCWVAIADKPLFNFAYTSSNGNSAISSYLVGPFGKLLLLDGVAADLPDHAPVDLAITPDNRFLYNTNAATGTVTAFRIKWNGDLTLLQETGPDLSDCGNPPAPTGCAVGIAVR
jgi:6-phosphogluconolactonase